MTQKLIVRLPCLLANNIKMLIYEQFPDLDMGFEVAEIDFLDWPHGTVLFEEKASETQEDSRQTNVVEEGFSS